MLPAPTYHDPMSDASDWLHSKVPGWSAVPSMGNGGGIDRLHIATAEKLGQLRGVKANDEFQQDH